MKITKKQEEMDEKSCNTEGNEREHERKIRRKRREGDCK